MGIQIGILEIKNDTTGVRIGNIDIEGLKVAAQVVWRKATASVYTLSRQMDRVFSSDTPASGGGNTTPDTFEHDGNTWQVWQVIPFIGSNVVSSRVGYCRVHLRNRGVNRGQMTLESMPSKIEITNADWTGSPWTFTRPTSEATFTNAGSGQQARKSLDYIPDRTPLASAAASGMSLTADNTQGETFTIKFTFDS